MQEYFEKFATSDPTQLEAAAAAAATKSYAYAYAQHRANVAMTLADAGVDMSGTSEVTVDADAVTVCDSSDATQCSKYGDFTFRDGRLADFTVDGVDIKGRLVLGDGFVVKSKGVAGFELLSAYQAIGTNSLAAVVRFHAYDRPINTSYIATYRDPSGRQVEDGGSSTLPSSIAPRSNQLGLVLIPRSKVGGDLILKYATDDDKDPLIVEEVKVSTAPGRG